MSTPSAKRRRLDDAQSTLRKPFRSPFKTPSRKLENPSAETTHSSTAVPSPLAHDDDDDEGAATTLPADSSKSSNASALRSLRNSRSSTTLSSTTTPSKTRTPFSPRRGADDTAMMRAEEQRQRQLGRQIRDARAELDTLDQALTFATSNKDAELAALTRKWRDATRAAAEEVFAGAKERVDGMGGVGAWRRGNQSQSQRGWGFDDGAAAREGGPPPPLGGSEDDGDDEGEEGLTPEERESRLVAREQRADARAEAKNERRWREEQWPRTQKPPSGGDEGEEDEVGVEFPFSRWWRPAKFTSSRLTRHRASRWIRC